ncbi:MAG: hypothetical protein R3E89_15025 [Thiolinea sp.]
MPLALTQDYPTVPLDALGISINYMRAAEIVPLYERDGVLVMAMSDPGDSFARQALQMAAGRPIRPLLGLPRNPHQIERLYSGQAGKDEDEFEITSHDSGVDDIEHLKDMARKPR